MISILIAEDDSLLRGLLSDILAGQNDLKVIGTVATAEEALRAAREHRPEVLLLDLNLPGLHGLKALDHLGRREGSPQALILSGEETEEMQLEAARRGARGFVAKSEGSGSLPAAIRAVAAGDIWFPGWVVGRIFREHAALYRRMREEDSPASRLSDRERQVIIRVARGMTNQQIGRELEMSLSTVKVHVRHILQKWDLQNRTEAAIFARREGLLDDLDE